MPELPAIVWLGITGLLGLLIAVVAYFLKRTMTTTDNHGAAIGKLEKNSATKDEVKKHGEDINHIKQTYVTKEDMKEMRTELRAEIEKISVAVGEIREANLPKEDFYRSHIETNRKLEQLQQLIVDRLGGQ